MWKRIVISALVLVLIILALWNSYKCAKLELENAQLKIEHNTLVISLQCENDLLNSEIGDLKELLNSRDYTIDSLKRVKQKVIVKKEFVTSCDITEGVALLQKNLKWEKQ